MITLAKREIAQLIGNKNFFPLSPFSFSSFSSSSSSSFFLSDNHSNSKTTDIDPLDPDSQERLKLDDFAGEPYYLNPHWYRFPQSSDGHRSIRPDYPDLPLDKHSYQHRDPYARYDDQQFRRNFNETLPEEYDILAMNSFDVEKTFSMRYMVTGALTFILSVYGLYKFISWLDPMKPPYRLPSYKEPTIMPPVRRVWTLEMNKKINN